MVTGLVIYFAIAAALTLAYAAARPRLKIRRHRRKLRAMTPDELAEEARSCAKGAGYDTAFADAVLFHQRRDWSQTSLARAIEDLYAKAAAQDQQEGNRGGPGSLVFYFYDFGLASIREVLDEHPPA